MKTLSIDVVMLYINLDFIYTFINDIFNFIDLYNFF